VWSKHGGFAGTVVGWRGGGGAEDGAVITYRWRVYIQYQATFGTEEGAYISKSGDIT
jgi:hypothetical protein